MLTFIYLDEFHDLVIRCIHFSITFSFNTFSKLYHHRLVEKQQKVRVKVNNLNSLKEFKIIFHSYVLKNLKTVQMTFQLPV